MHGGGVANAKPKYPPDASGGYNYVKVHIRISCSNPYIFEKDVSNMAAEHTLAEQKGHTMMHTYIYMHHLTNVPTKCQPSTPYGIQEIFQIRF